MLKTIPHILTPDILRTMSAMGHGDELVLADANFPPETCGKNSLVLSAGRVGVPELFEAMLKYFPLDTFVKESVILMSVVPGDNFVPVIWEKYNAMVKASGASLDVIGYNERFEFYERAAKAFAVITTGELSQYGNIILKKGLIVTP